MWQASRRFEVLKRISLQTGFFIDAGFAFAEEVVEGKPVGGVGGGIGCEECGKLLHVQRRPRNQPQC